MEKRWRFPLSEDNSLSILVCSHNILLIQCTTQTKAFEDPRAQFVHITLSISNVSFYLQDKRFCIIK